MSVMYTTFVTAQEHSRITCNTTDTHANTSVLLLHCSDTNVQLSVEALAFAFGYVLGPCGKDSAHPASAFCSVTRTSGQAPLAPFRAGEMKIYVGDRSCSQP